jgi:hypothetical protein
MVRILPEGAERSVRGRKYTGERGAIGTRDSLYLASDEEGPAGGAAAAASGFIVAESFPGASVTTPAEDDP